jgi:glycerol-3-phosphate acyltransferase PlsX
MRVALDAVGGDNYPVAPVQGAVLAVQDDPELSVILVGQEDLISDELSKTGYDGKQIVIQHADEIIGMDDSAATALKSKPQSSIHVGLGLHAKGYSDAFVSAGNTGALLAASAVILGRLPHVLRPTIASYYPTIQGFRLLVDAGANLEPKAEFLYQFGIMGSVYATYFFDVDTPRIGLLNIGEEKEKGTETLKKAYELLSTAPNFVGNVEGRDVLPCKADVFVCDGVAGNILLKFGESLASELGPLFGLAMKKLQLNEEEMTLCTSVLREAFSPFDYQGVGGVPFLGVNGVSLVGHGKSSPTAIKNMISHAVKMVDAKINDKIVEALAPKN